MFFLIQLSEMQGVRRENEANYKFKPYSIPLENRTPGFLIFSGGIERNQGHEMG